MSDLTDLLEAVMGIDPEAELDKHLTMQEAARVLSLVRKLRSSKGGVLQSLDFVFNDHLAGLLADGKTDVPDVGPCEVHNDASRTEWRHDRIRSVASAYICEIPSVWANADGEPHPNAVTAARVLKEFANIVGNPSSYRPGDARKNPPGPGWRTTLRMDPADACTERWTRKVTVPRPDEMGKAK